MHVKNLDYDIKNEQDYLPGDSNPVQKFYIYKTARDNFDCDCCYFAMENARQLYPFLANSIMQKQQGQGKKFELHVSGNPPFYRGDTCNSYHTLYRVAVTKLLTRNEYLDICRQFGDPQKEYLHDLLAEHDGLGKEFEKRLPLNIGSLMREFALVNHTLPNLMALPKGLNVPRYRFTSDNFSLFLYAAYQYLDKNDAVLINKIFGATAAAAKSYLDSFDNWQRYVTENLLLSYLDDNFVPREFIQGQFQRFVQMTERKDFASLNYLRIEPYTCPQTPAEFAEYLENVISILKGRRADMASYIQAKS